MPQLLLELFSEEIPARMQKRAEEDLAKLMGDKLKAAGLEPKAMKTFSTPRRLGLVIDDLPAKAADVNEEKKGPRVGAPDQAIQGFLKSAGLARIEDAQVVEDKKGAFYVAKIERAGRATAAIVQEIVPEIVRAFLWPKSMRSGSSDLQWVRPLHNICCTFDGTEVKIAISDVPSEAVTWGHRFHAPREIRVTTFEKYCADLAEGQVVINRDERKRMIVGEARHLCEAKGLELIDDPGLLEEVVGLAELPIAFLGEMDPAFLDLPGEVIRLSMRTHQKYFAVRDPKTGKLAPHFITVANVRAKDGGKAIAAGNARVLSARLNDARFFWDTDRKTPLYTEERKAKLEKIVFHQKLGSVWDKVVRVKALARELAPIVWNSLDRHSGAMRSIEPGSQGQTHSPSPPWNDEALARFVEAVERAAELCKMDLVTETVGEFPELQGQVGRQLYALEPGANASIAAAIEDHYRPLGPNDRVPTDPVAVTLALADKLDTLVAFWAVDEKPTGSSDPYALRRSALGLVRILLATEGRFRLQGVIGQQFSAFERHRYERSLRAAPLSPDQRSLTQRDLLAFLADRLKVQLRDQGKRHDLVDAVFALGDDDLVRIVGRVEALDAFLKTENGANLLAGYKRAANILAAEEKKEKWSAEEAQGQVDAAQLIEPAEKALAAALDAAIPTARSAVEREDFAGAMKALAGLRAPVDAFFEKVMVNAEDRMLRRNRLLLLSRLREALSAVADFSKIEG